MGATRGWLVVVALLVAAPAMAAAKTALRQTITTPSPETLLKIEALTNKTRLVQRFITKGLKMLNYSDPVPVGTYSPPLAPLDVRAMGPLYNLTEVVIAALVPEQPFPKGFLVVKDGNVEVSNTDWKELFQYYLGTIGVVTVSLLFAMILTLVGVCWCCCYCCRSKKRRPFDRKYDAFVKVLLALILIGLLTVFLFGVVCAFATERQMEEGVEAAPQAVRYTTHDLGVFFNRTRDHVYQLIKIDYGLVKEKINTVYNMSGARAALLMEQRTRAGAVRELHAVVSRLGGAQRGLRSVRDLCGALRHQAEQLNAGLRKAKHRLLRTLADCDTAACLTLQQKYRISELDTDIQYSQMPDVSELLNNVTTLLDGGIEQEVAEGERALGLLQLELEQAVQAHVPQLRSNLLPYGTELAQLLQEVGAAEAQVQALLREGLRGADLLEQTHDQYVLLRRLPRLAAASALLLLVLVACAGLACGVCGRRPDAYGAADCCSKASGAKCLVCVVLLAFLLGGALTLLSLAYFLAGVGARRAVCDPLYEPRGSVVMDLVDDFVDLPMELYGKKLNDSTFTISGVISSCHANDTMYSTLRLHNVLDLIGFAGRVNVSLRAGLERALAAQQWRPRARTLVSPAARRKLRQLQEAGLDAFPAERVLRAADTNMTSLELGALAGSLRRTAAAAGRHAEYAAVAAELAQAAQELAALHQDIVLPMVRNTQALNSTVLELRAQLSYGNESLGAAARRLLADAQFAERQMAEDPLQAANDALVALFDAVGELVSNYVSHVLDKAASKLGRCGPVSRAFNTSRDAFCQKVLAPANGFWLSMFWCLLLLVPLMVVCTKLSWLYLHVDAYPGPVIEAEYLYDAYADRDNLPLANAYKIEKRGFGFSARRDDGEGAGVCGVGGAAGAGGGGGGGGGAGARRGGGAGEGQALAPALDAHHARRYNDMAPKHWEEGPPRYLGPTEYERPPPYYYPGPNDRQ